MATAPVRVALVTGANRGIGRAVAVGLARLGHHVYLGARNGNASVAAAELRAAGVEVSPLDLDVADPRAAAEAVDRIVAREGHLDILVNNAATGYDPIGAASTADLDETRVTFDVNLFGPWRLAQAAIPAMRLHGYGRIVNISSDAGAFSMVARPPVDPGTAVYSVTKAALNMLTVKLAAAVTSEDILINALDPGWVRTRMGGPDAPREPEDAAAEVIVLATLPSGGPSGVFFRAGREVPW